MDWDGLCVVSNSLSLRVAPSGNLAGETARSPEPLEVSRDALEALLAFRRPRTPRQVLDELAAEWDVDASDFAAMVGDWLAGGWLQVIDGAERRPGRMILFQQAMDAWTAKGRAAPFGLLSPLPLQRPGSFYPGLDSREVHDGARFPWVPALEGAAGRIAAELDGLLRKRSGFSRIYEDFTGEGAWAAAQLFVYGERIDAVCDLCPETARLLESIPGAASFGKVLFSALAAHTYLIPHCGTSNVKLRCQLPLRVPAGCCLRIGEQTVRLEEGKCVLFDDSFLHTAWNPSDQPRFVLLFDFYHPDLTALEVEYLSQVALLDQARKAHPGQVKADETPGWVYAGV
jgi:Aspartyl/Asparaginyl beta-hydroxylase